jgi:hypothetical protein
VPGMILLQKKGGGPSWGAQKSTYRMSFCAVTKYPRRAHFPCQTAPSCQPREAHDYADRLS